MALLMEGRETWEEVVVELWGNDESDQSRREGLLGLGQPRGRP